MTLLLLHELVPLALLIEIKVHVLLAQIWVVAAVSHAAVWVALLPSVAGEVLYWLVLDQHGLPSELLVDRQGTSKSVTLMVVEDSVVLSLCDLLRSSHW